MKLKEAAASLFILSFLGFQIVSGVRSLVTEEKRFGWAMFAQPVFHRIRVYGIQEEERPKIPIKNEKYLRWLKGRARSHLQQRKTFQRSGYGLRAIEEEGERFGRFLCEKSLGKEYQQIEIVLEHFSLGPQSVVSKTVRSRCSSSREFS